MPKKPMLLNSPKQRQGRYYEQMALTFLQQQGLQLIAQNWQQPKIGELDLVMLQPKQNLHGWDILVFIEVRQRQASGFGDALASVTPAKQRKLYKTAQYFLQQHAQYADIECRFDVIVFNEQYRLNKQGKQMLNLQPDWLQNAFTGTAW